MIARIRAALRDDRGFTLMEMLAASAVFAMIMTGLVGVILVTTNTQRTVSIVSASTTDAQLVANGLDTRIRNSSEFQVTTSGTTQLVVARVAGAQTTLTWRCYGWYYSAADGGTIRMTSTAPGTKITMPTAAQAATWTELLSGVVPRSGTTVFSAVDNTLSVSFNATADDHQPIAIDFTTARLTAVSEALTCY
jgi:prepilin-type N-terminal cleavage/methylation domain-containing protein